MPFPPNHYLHLFINHLFSLLSSQLLYLFSSNFVPLILNFPLICSISPSLFIFSHFFLPLVFTFYLSSASFLFSSLLFPCHSLSLICCPHLIPIFVFTFKHISLPFTSPLLHLPSLFSCLFSYFSYLICPLTASILPSFSPFLFCLLIFSHPTPSIFLLRDFLPQEVEGANPKKLF